MWFFKHKQNVFQDMDFNILPKTNIFLILFKDHLSIVSATLYIRYLQSINQQQQQLNYL